MCSSSAPKRKRPAGRAPIHLNDIGRKKLAKLLAEPVAEAVTNALRARRTTSISGVQ